MVQERTVRLPPAFTLGLQLISGFLFGLLGLAFALAIAAAGKVIIEELYVKDGLGGSWSRQAVSGPARIKDAAEASEAKAGRSE
jgi:predicted PurR-regulated permease PerM